MRTNYSNSRTASSRPHERLNAERFVTYFSDRSDFVYLINTRHIGTRDSVHAAFANLLSAHERFEPTWGTRQVQILSDRIGVLTGFFETTAQERTGEQWETRGIVTFVAVKEPDGWRIVNWHTTE
jgi:ketosteroid isomerase-like protein